MPAAAVIPAPIAYIKVVAVKKLVVGFLVWGGVPCSSLSTFAMPFFPPIKLRELGARVTVFLAFSDHLL